MRNFDATSNIKNYIYFNNLKGEFVVPKHSIKYLFKKPQIHSVKDITEVCLLSDSDCRDTFLGLQNFCIEVVIMIILKDGNRCYIDFLKKPTIARSWKCKKAFKEANEVKQALLFMQKVGNYTLQRQKSNITYIPRTLAKAE